MQNIQSEVISVLIACDHKTNMRNLRSSISNLNDVKIVGLASTSSMAVRISEKSNPNVVVISSRDPNFDGLLTAKLIKSRSGSKILLLGKDFSEDDIIKAFSLGVDGYCRQTSDVGMLSDAIRSVAKGNLWIDDKIAQKVVSILKDTDPKSTSKHKKLNDNEYKIFKKMAEGENLESIINQLGLTSDSALDQICRVLQKLSLGEDVNWLFRKEETPKNVIDFELARKCTHCKAKLDISNQICPHDGKESIIDPLLGTLFADKYEILALEGSGATGSVYKARHRYLRNYLAIKILHAELMSDLNFLHRLRQEAAATMALNHPNIIRVHDFGITNSGNAYLVMDFLEGISLEEYIDQNGALNPNHAQELFKKIASGLSFANKNGIIHRDIKPSNIIMSSETSSLQKILIVDFGIAKTNIGLSMISTRAGEFYGTPLYMSPEQCKGEPVDARSDIYSLGCLMYEALSGRPPHIADSCMEVMNMQIHETPISLLTFSTPHRIPAELNDIVMKAIEKEPEKRFKTMDQLITALVKVQNEKKARRKKLKFKIEWIAKVGIYRLTVSSTEIVDAANSSDCLSIIRTSIITKLGTLNNVYYITAIKFVNVGNRLTVSTDELYRFMNSLNEEGGLMKNVPKEPPKEIFLEEDSLGNMVVNPVRKR